MNKEIKRLDLNTPDGAQLNMDALYQIAPSVFTESCDEKTGELKRVVNFDALRQLLGDNAVDENRETYEFRWVGKDEAKAEAARPTDKTLRPVVEDSVDWDNTKNLYIEGDNLEVLKLLQRSYMGKVKMIYIDPPYNTGNDFVYHDDFAMSSDEYDEASGAVDDLGNKYVKNTETSGRFHSDWCNMIYPRLMVARSLLTEDGVIFISINDCEQRNLKNICDDIFGENNFITQLVWQQRKGGGNDSRFVATDHEYIVIYAKNILSQNYKWRIAQSEEYQKRYNLVEEDGRRYYWDTLVRNGLQNPIVLNLTTPTGEAITINSQWSKERVMSGLSDGTVKFTQTSNGWSLHHKVYLKGGQVLRSLLTEFGTNKTANDEQVALFGEVLFDYPKPSTLVKCFAELISSKEAIILDFFSGSATTAHAVMQLNAEDRGNRKFIMVQLPELTDEDSEAYKAGYDNICEIGEERIRRAGEKIKEEHPEVADTLDTGFRIFYVDDSNFNPGVKASPSEYNQQQLDLFANNIKADRNDLDLLFGSILAWGLQLDLPMETEEVDGCKIYTVNDGDLVACFAEKVTDKVIEAMAEKEPLRVLFRDSCFDSDDKKINLFETFKQKLDWTDDEAFNNIRVI